MEFSIFVREVSDRHNGEKDWHELIELRFVGHIARLFVGSGEEPRGTYHWNWTLGRFEEALNFDDDPGLIEEPKRVKQELLEQIVRGVFQDAAKAAVKRANRYMSWLPDRRRKGHQRLRPFYSGESMLDVEDTDGYLHELDAAWATGDRDKMMEVAKKLDSERGTTFLDAAE